MRSPLTALWDKNLHFSVHIESLHIQWREHVVWPWQRMRRGYSDRDLWSFDWYLARVLAHGIHHLANHKAGFVPLTKDYEVDWDKGKSKHYTRLLNEMADGFAVQHECDSAGQCSEDQQAKIDRSWELLARFHHFLWD